MLYILDQRLRAQNILKDKASKGGSMDVVREDCSWVGVGIAWGGRGCSLVGVEKGHSWKSVSFPFTFNFSTLLANVQPIPLS